MNIIRRKLWASLMLFCAFSQIAMAAPPGPSQTDPVIVSGASGQLTQKGFNAYMQALEFCLTQVGNPVQFDTNQRIQFRQQMIQAFPSLPAEAQQNLAQAEQLWNQYRQSWETLPVDSKKQFAYDVLSLAYGEQAAAQALDINQHAGKQSGGVTSHYSTGGAGGYGSYASDGKCSYFSSGGMSMSTCD